MPKCQMETSGIFFVIYGLSFSLFVIQSEAKNLGNTHYYATEILPPFGRLNDKLKKNDT